MIKTRILIVDDEVSVIKFLRANLESNGYEVVAAVNGAEALKTLEMELPDVVITDIMMPVLDGFELCRQIREWSQVPIIMLSARADESDKIKCLDLGADDYITKPFGKGELIARVGALLRRAKGDNTKDTNSNFTCGPLSISFAQRKVTVDDKPVKLSPTEYSLLQELVLNAGKVLTHTHLLHKIWGAEYMEEREYLHVFVARLRSKLEFNPANPRYITTVSGVGYQFENS